MKKKLLAAVLSVSMLTALTGCSDKDDEGVLKAAEDYATAVSGVNVSDIAGLMVGGADIESVIEDCVTGADYNTTDDWADIVSAIEGTITYEINSESVTSSKKEASGSVSITWTLVDSDAVYDQISEEGGDADDFIAALQAEDAEKVQIEQTLNLVLEEETWLIDDENANDLLDVYSFYADAVDYVFESPLMEYISEDYWYYSDDSVYTNVDRIELDIITTDEGEEVEFNFTYEYYLNGELIYTSDEWTDEGHWIEAYYGPYYDDAALVNENGNLIDGEYRCIIYDLNGIVIADNTCTVLTAEYPEADASMIDDVVWYWTDHDDVYVDEDAIELDIIPASDAQDALWHFYYEIYLDGELIYTSEDCEDQGAWIEAYYNAWYEGSHITDDGYLVPGEYTCIIYDMGGNELAQSTCTVELS